MLYLSLFCLNLVYVNVYVPKLGGGVVPKSDVYNYSDPCQCPLCRRRTRGAGVCQEKGSEGQLDGAEMQGKDTR